MTTNISPRLVGRHLVFGPKKVKCQNLEYDNIANDSAQRLVPIAYCLVERFPTGGEFPPSWEFGISQGGNLSLPRFKKNMLNIRQKQFSS